MTKVGSYRVDYIRLGMNNKDTCKVQSPYVYGWKEKKTLYILCYFHLPSMVSFMPRRVYVLLNAYNL